MSVPKNKTVILESLISTAEYMIGKYLKDNPDCLRTKLMPHVLENISTRENRKGEIVHDKKPIHTLAFIIAMKELEKEGVIEIDRGDVPFPMTDFKTRFRLKQ